MVFQLLPTQRAPLPISDTQHTTCALDTMGHVNMVIRPIKNIEINLTQIGNRFTWQK